MGLGKITPFPIAASAGRFRRQLSFSPRFHRFPERMALFMQPVLKSNKLANVLYDIRGPVMARAKQMEEDGQRIIKLNIGNPAPFGFTAPEEIIQDIIHNMSEASGYSDSKGMFAARKAIMHYTQEKNIQGVQVDDIYIGNGVSELIVMAMNALLNAGDEVLVPAPDYPL
jgi:alanine-synthesizing transaminase